MQQTLAGGGVAVSLRPVTPSYVAVPDPDAPYANAQGMVAAPNVDVGAELVDGMVAAAEFKANLAVFLAASEMMKSLLDSTRPKSRYDRQV